jgi:hypothetical protein
LGARRVPRWLHAPAARVGGSCTAGTHLQGVLNPGVLVAVARHERDGRLGRHGGEEPAAAEGPAAAPPPPARRAPGSRVCGVSAGRRGAPAASTRGVWCGTLGPRTEPADSDRVGERSAAARGGPCRCGDGGGFFLRRDFGGRAPRARPSPRLSHFHTRLRAHRRASPAARAPVSFAGTAASPFLPVAAWRGQGAGRGGRHFNSGRGVPLRRAPPSRRAVPSAAGGGGGGGRGVTAPPLHQSVVAVVSTSTPRAALAGASARLHMAVSSAAAAAVPRAGAPPPAPGVAPLRVPDAALVERVLAGEFDSGGDGSDAGSLDVWSAVRGAGGGSPRGAAALSAGGRGAPLRALGQSLKDRSSSFGSAGPSSGYASAAAASPRAGVGGVAGGRAAAAAPHVGRHRRSRRRPSCPHGQHHRAPCVHGSGRACGGI